jgi:hypothetical protein
MYGGQVFGGPELRFKGICLPGMAVLEIVFSRFFLAIANSTVFHLEYDLLSKRYLRPLLFQKFLAPR